MDEELKILEHDLVPLAEAMPAARYDFAPANEEFKGVRTFGQQVMHVAGNIYGASATVLGEKPSVKLEAGGGGPANLCVSLCVSLCVAVQISLIFQGKIRGSNPPGSAIFFGFSSQGLTGQDSGSNHRQRL